MFAHARNRHVEHVREVWSSFARASSCRSAWVKSPRKWSGGRFTTTEKRLELLRKEKKEKKGKKKEKKQVFPQGRIKAFLVRPYFFHTFLLSVVSQKFILFRLRSQNLWFMGNNFSSRRPLIIIIGRCFDKRRKKQSCVI